MTVLARAETMEMAGEPLRLGYLIDSLTTGGAERLVVTFAEEACQRQEVALTVFVLSGGASPFREAIERLGIPVVEVTGRSLIDPGRFRHLVAALRARRIEYLHAHLTSATVIGGFAALVAGVPFGTTVHNTRPSTRRVSFARRTLYRLALRRRSIDRIAVGSAVAAAAEIDSGGRRFVVVPNAVAASAVGKDSSTARLRAELGVDATTLMLLAVGALIPQKGYFDLLSAYARMQRRDETHLFVAGGDHGLGAEIERHATELGVADRVHLLGGRRDIPDLLAASDVFVSASHWEGAPVSLLEALANGLPCVVTDVGDNGLTLAGAPWPCVPAGDVAALADAMDAAVADAGLRERYAAFGHEVVRARFTASAWVDRLLAIYAQRTPRKSWWAPERAR